MHFVKVSAPVRILSWLGLSETEMEAATELASSGESLESAKRLQAPGDDSAHLPAIASVVTDEQVAAYSRQLVTQEGCDVRGCHGRTRHQFQKS